MGQDAPNHSRTRRRFLRDGVILVCAAPLVRALPGCEGEPAEALEIDGWIVPEGTHLPPEDFARLAALFDALVPGSPEEPGATECHAAWYLDQLLGAFDTDPPRIYAGGPYSGRHGGADGFSRFQPLTRVEELRWRTFLEGSKGLPEREWAGPVQGLEDRYLEQLDFLQSAGRGVHGQRFTLLDTDTRRDLLADLDPDFLQLAYGHAVEGCYGDPVYGGNSEMRGWTLIQYEGDRQPLGYTSWQMSHPEEG